MVENAGDEKYAGSDYVKCSPYHIVAIFSQLTAFAKAGAGLEVVDRALEAVRAALAARDARAEAPAA